MTVRVSVVAGTRRVDLAVPPAVPVAELLPGLAGRLALTSYAGLRLCTLDGTVLSDSEGLPGQVPDGSVLVLTPAPRPAPVHDDVAEALASVVGSVPGWPVAWTAATRVAGAACLLGLACVGVLLTGSARVAAVTALLAAAAAVGVSRRDSVAAVVLGWAASGSAGIAGWLLAPTAELAWAGAGGAVIAVGGVLFAGLDRGRLWLLPLLGTGTASALVGALLPQTPLRLSLAVLLVAATLLHVGLPRLLTGRLDQPDVPVDVARLAAEATRARDLLTALSGGTGLLVAALAPAAPAVAAVCSLLVLLRIRHHRARDEIVVAVATAGLGTVLAVATTLAVHPGWRPIAAGAAALAGVLLLAPAVPEPRRSWLLDRAEAACLIVLPPLLLVTTGALELLPWTR